MPSLKRKKAENTADFRVYVDTEDPDCKSPIKKKRKKAENQVGPEPFGERSSNLSPHIKMGKKNIRESEVLAHLPYSGVGGSLIRPSSKEKSEDQDPNQLLHWEKKVLEKNHGTHSPRTLRVDNFFPKTYKKTSPTNKQENPQRSPCRIFCELRDGADIKMMLSERSKSICKIDVTGEKSKQGTGFVLVDNLIITCAHLFRGFLEGKKLKEGTNVSVLFNFHGSQPNRNSFVFTVEKTIVAINEKLDCVFLELKPDVQNPNQRVPPGLLEQFGPLTENDKIFIIGHPRGKAKKCNSTFVIELGMRQRAVYKNLSPLKDNFVQMVQDMNVLGLQDVMNGGVKEKEVETYVTREMYEGASGSPVLNSDGQVTLMHTGGFGYKNPCMIHTVLEYGQRLDLIIQDLVRQLKESGNVRLLERIESVASKNEHLKKALEAEPMEIDKLPKEFTRKLNLY